MDYYLQNPEALEGQPKKTIADYVEQNGILVPRRFDSLSEARKSHKRILLRSEHLQEYDGISGLLDSFDLSSSSFPVRGSQSIEEVKPEREELEPDDETYKKLLRWGLVYYVFLIALFLFLISYLAYVLVASNVIMAGINNIAPDFKRHNEEIQQTQDPEQSWEVP